MSEHSRKLEDTGSHVKQVEGQHEVQELIAQQNSEKLKTITKHLGIEGVEKTDSEVQGKQEEKGSSQSVNFGDCYQILCARLCLSVPRHNRQYPVIKCSRKCRNRNLNWYIAKYMPSELS